MAMAAGFVWLTAGAAAQGLQVSPVSTEMLSGQMVATITVDNRDPAPVNMQARSYAWTQDSSGGEKLSPTALLDVSPPIFKIPGNGAQLVRLVLRKPATDSEDAYRVLFDQLPTQDSGGSISLALRVSVPVFVEPRSTAGPELDLHIVSGGGTAQLVAINKGARHDRLISPTLNAGVSVFGVTTGPGNYVLAGSELRWPLTGRLASLRPGMTLQLKAKSLAGAFDKALPVTSP